MKKLISAMVIMASLAGCAEHPYLSAAGAASVRRRLPQQLLTTRIAKKNTTVKSASSVNSVKISTRGGITTIIPMMTVVTITAEWRC